MGLWPRGLSFPSSLLCIGTGVLAFILDLELLGHSLLFHFWGRWSCQAFLLFLESLEEVKFTR